MPSVNVDLLYFEDQKTEKLIEMLGRGAEVLPIRLWCYCGKHHPKDGRLTGYSADKIEKKIGWWGKRGKAIEALLTCGGHLEKAGYLEIDASGTYFCHEWNDQQGHIHVFKERSKIANKARWDSHKSKTPNKEENASSNPIRNPSGNPLAVLCGAVLKPPLSPFGVGDGKTTETPTSLKDEIKIFKDLNWSEDRIKQHFRETRGMSEPEIQEVMKDV